MRFHHACRLVRLDLGRGRTSESSTSAITRESYDCHLSPAPIRVQVGQYRQSANGVRVTGEPIITAPWPRHDDEEVSAVVDVLRSGRTNYWTGDQGRSFEREFADSIGVAHAIFVANGTLALELAIRALELPPDSAIVTTPRTFIASTSAIVATGHRPVYADVDPDSGNITASTIAAALTPDTSAVLVVHLGGWPADLPAIRELCDARGLRLIEDCAQAHGAMVAERHVGSVGDVAAWSFCQDKIITTGGEGGMVATNDDARWRTMWAYKDHGKSIEAVYERAHPEGFRWLHDSFGSNYRGTEAQAAIARLQYRKLADWRAARTANALALSARLKRVPGLRVPLPPDDVTHAFYRLYAYIEPGQLADGWDYARVLAELAARGLPAMAGSCAEIYRERAVEEAGFAPPQSLPSAQSLGRQSLAFRVHPGIDEHELERVADTVAAVMAEATGRSAALAMDHASGRAR